MNSAFATQVWFHSQKGETLLLKTDLRRSNVVVSRSIQWKVVSLPEEWTPEEVVQTEPLYSFKPNTHIKSVTQYTNGRISISFDRSTTTNRSDDSTVTDTFEIYALNKSINYPFQKTISPITHRENNCRFQKNSIYPSPSQGIKINIQNQQIEVIPFKTPEEDEKGNIKKIIKQNNYTNTNLNTIRKQLDIIDKNIQPLIIYKNPREKRKDSIQKPFFKPYQITHASAKNSHDNKTDLIRTI
ncbi:hypothetical protein MIMGU_mgv11b023255mg [Erythranthe guttata]|uniref:Uncharacterized protein n=1 Tax=Erythranthe guttata TaxID=4155 RepID=A0A022QR89_ERYGU|nr:hypothetical protein MIMGU_mgv11b023255mg [Erythranthe guttata]